MADIDQSRLSIGIGSRFFWVIFLICTVTFFNFSPRGYSTFFGEPLTGYHSIKSDRYGASYFVPADYTPARDWPLVVVMYSDESQKGSEFVEKWLKRITERGVIALFISYLRPQEAPHGSDRRLLRHLNKIKSMYSIDDRHVLLTAYGEAAHYAFYLGHRYPDMFSAVGMEAGGAVGRYNSFLEQDQKNAKNVSFLILIGNQDETINQKPFLTDHQKLVAKGYNVTIESLEGFGHKPQGEFHDRILEWFGGLAPKPVDQISESRSEELSHGLFGLPRTLIDRIRDFLKVN